MIDQRIVSARSGRSFPPMKPFWKKAGSCRRRGQSTPEREEINRLADAVVRGPLQAGRWSGEPESRRSQAARPFWRHIHPQVSRLAKMVLCMLEFPDRQSHSITSRLPPNPLYASLASRAKPAATEPGSLWAMKRCRRVCRHSTAARRPAAIRMAGSRRRSGSRSRPRNRRREPRSIADGEDDFGAAR